MFKILDTLKFSIMYYEFVGFTPFFGRLENVNKCIDKLYGALITCMGKILNMSSLLACGYTSECRL
jgi:hypothetical protein